MLYFCISIVTYFYKGIYAGHWLQTISAADTQTVSGSSATTIYTLQHNNTNSTNEDVITASTLSIGDYNTSIQCIANNLDSILLLGRSMNSSEYTSSKTIVLYIDVVHVAQLEKKQLLVFRKLMNTLLLLRDLMFQRQTNRNKY